MQFLGSEKSKIRCFFVLKMFERREIRLSVGGSRNAQIFEMEWAESKDELEQRTKHPDEYEVKFKQKSKTKNESEQRADRPEKYEGPHVRPPENPGGSNMGHPRLRSNSKTESKSKTNSKSDSMLKRKCGFFC
jgi:hypothetical protein